MIDRLVFDTTDTDTQAESSNVGAYLRSSDGTLLTHTTVGGKEALDVRLAEGVNVEVDLSHVDDSVRLGDGTSFFTSTSENGDIALDVHISNTSLAVTATDLDIRDLVQATDSVSIGDGTTLFDAAVQDVAAGAGHAGFASMAVRDDTLTTLTEADGDFTHLRTTDQGALWTFIAGSDPLTINDAALADTAIANASNDLGVANTAEDAVASPLANRKYLWIYNNGNRVVYIGSTGVTSANGFPISPSSYMELRAGASVDVEWVGPNTSQQIRTLELS